MCVRARERANEANGAGVGRRVGDWVGVSAGGPIYHAHTRECDRECLGVRIECECQLCACVFVRALRVQARGYVCTRVRARQCACTCM